MARTIPTLDPQVILTNADLSDDCWEWQGSKYKTGYGKYGKHGYAAHRMVYEMFNQEVPEDMYLDHLCRNRSCVKPEHLEVVTLVENVMRGESNHAVNARKTHCKWGHEFTQENIYRHPSRNTRHCRACMKLKGKKDGLTS